MSCKKCGRKTEWDFCGDCASEAGAVVRFREKETIANVYYEKESVFDILKMKLLGQKVIKCFVGTDSWMLVRFPKYKSLLEVIYYRLKMKFLRCFIDEYWAVSASLLPEIKKGLGVSAEVYVNPPYHQVPVKKRDHDRFIVGVYYPEIDSRYADYVHGVDIINRVIEELEYNGTSHCGITFFPIDRNNAETAFSLIDCYIRPSRHDGAPRLIEACKINNIPFCWSSHGNPDVKEFVGFILRERDKKRDLGHPDKL